MAMDPMWQLRGVWSGTSKPQVANLRENGKVTPEEDAEAGSDASLQIQRDKALDQDRLTLELRTYRVQAAELRQQLEVAEAEARDNRERADEVQEQSMLALDEASVQAQELNRRLKETVEESQRLKRQHEEELIMVMMSAKEKDDIRLAREAELEKELRSLQQRMERMRLEMGQGQPTASAASAAPHEESEALVQDLSAQLLSAQQQLQEMQEQLQEEEEELDSMEAELKKTRRRVDELSTEKATLVDEVENLRDQLAQEKELASVAERVAEDEVNRRLEAERQCAAALRELSRVRAEAEAAEDKFEAGQKEDEDALVTLQEQLAVAMEQYAAQEEEFSETVDTLKRDAEAREQGLRQAVDVKERELAEVKEKVAALEEQETVQNAQCSRLREENHRLKVEAAEVASTLSRLEADNRRLKGEVENRAAVEAQSMQGNVQPSTTGKGERPQESKQDQNQDEYASGSEFSFSLPVPIKGAWRAARELAAEYYDAGVGNEEDELAAREAELEEIQEENDRLAGEVEALQEQVVKSRRLVANYEKMRRRIMQLRVCLELTRKVVEVKDRAMEMAIERARSAEAHARELEEIQIQLEDQLAEVEDDLARALTEQEQQQQLNRAPSGADTPTSTSKVPGPEGLARDVSLRDNDGFLAAVDGAAASERRDGRRLDRLNQMNGRHPPGQEQGEGHVAGGDGNESSETVDKFPKSDTVNSHKKLELKLDLPGDSDDEEGDREKAVVRTNTAGSTIRRDKEVVGPLPALQRVETRRPKPLLVSRCSTSTSRNSEAVAPRAVTFVSNSGVLARVEPVGMKDLQLARDSLRRVMRELREKTAMHVEAQIELGERATKKKGKGKDDVLRPVETQVVEGQNLVDKVEKVLAKMAALEQKGGVLKKKMDTRKVQIAKLETQLGLNNSCRRNGASCFR